jgi:CheY-like chemotaxis protein
MAKESILIVDDQPVNLKLLSVLLTREGYEVRTAISAEEALTTLETFKPRLILLDVCLPGMDGLEFTQKLKADSRWRDIVILVITAQAMRGDEAKAWAAGCDGFLTKPIDTRTLPGVVARFMRCSNEPSTAEASAHGATNDQAGNHIDR